MKKKSFTARSFRIVLVVLILLVSAGGVAVYIYSSGLVNDYALEVGMKRGEAKDSDSRLAQYSKLESALAKYSKERLRAQQVVAEKQSYKYQDEVVAVITSFAARNGLTLTSITFEVKKAATGAASGSSSSSSSSSPSSGTSSNSTSSNTQQPNSPLAPSTVGTDTASSSADADAAPALATTTVTIVPKAPMNYEGFMNFIHDLELNLTRMQISNLNIQNKPTGPERGLTTSQLSLEVYIK